MPKVSVIIPTYNRSEYICESIDSVLAQTYKDYEIIVIDDGSTDNTGEVLKKYGTKIKYLYQENKGVGAARNLGIRNSNGEYIGLLDDDDIWLSDKLDIQVRILDENTDLAFVCSGAYFIDTVGRVIRFWESHRHNETFKNLYEGNFVLNLTVLMRKSCFDKVGGYDEKLLVAQDYDLWLRLANNYKFKYIINCPLAKYRIHENNISNNLGSLFSNRITIYNKKDFLKSIGSLKSKIRLAKEYLEAAEYSYTINNFHKAIIYYIKSVLGFPLIGYYHWPKETKKFRFTFLYRILKVYYMIIKSVIRYLLI